MSVRGLLERLLVAMIRDVERELRRLATITAHLDDRRNRLRAFLRVVRKAEGSTAIVEPPDDSTAKRGAKAFPIAAPLEWEHAADGSAVVTVTYEELNATQPVRKVAVLTAASARVLAILDVQPTGLDGFPVQLRRSELAALLSAKESEPVDPHTVTQRLTRLQDDFAQAGLKSFWIDRGRKGVRLLIRRGGPAITVPTIVRAR